MALRCARPVSNILRSGNGECVIGRFALLTVLLKACLASHAVVKTDLDHDMQRGA